MKRIALTIPILAAMLASSLAAQKAMDKPVDRLGPYALGATYESLKDLDGFEADPSRDNAAEGIKAARLIARPFLGQPAIHRLFFKDGKLARLSIIFISAAFGEENVKALIAKEWGDPGPKWKLDAGPTYVWVGTRGTAQILPADRGLWMASLALTPK